MGLPPSDTGNSVRFALSEAPGSRVFVAGTFNNWNPTANPLKDDPASGHFKAALPIPTGTHEYKFVVNGVWTIDPKCADWAPNCYGGLNSVLQV